MVNFNNRKSQTATLTQKNKVNGKCQKNVMFYYLRQKHENMCL